MALPGVLRLLRPANAAMTAVAVVVAAYVAGGLAGLEGAIDRVALGALAAFAFAGAGNAANDLRDERLDRTAHPDRPLVTGEVTRGRAVTLVLALYATALLAGVVIGGAAVALVAAALILMEGYERGLKALGLPGNVAVALLTGAPFVLGGLAVGAVPPTLLVLATLAVLATLGREILKDVEDLDADEHAGRRTLPMRIGAARAAAVAAVVLAVAVVLSPAPLLLRETLLGWSYLPVVALADAGFLAAAALAADASRAPRAQRLAKASMLVALVAFVAGRVELDVMVRGGT